MCDQNGDWQGLDLDEFLAEHCERPDSAKFAAELVDMVRSKLDETDGLLERCADNWALKRIAAVERNVLRLAAAELLAGELSPKIIISEAVAMAKKFGSKDSPRFVNGILDKAHKLMREAG